MNNLTIIGDRRCPTTWAYLHYLYKAKLKIKNLWLVDFFNSKTRNKYKRLILNTFIAKSFISLNRDIKDLFKNKDFKKLSQDFQFDASLEIIKNMRKKDLNQISANVSYFSFSGFDDENLKQKIIENVDTAFLYTNGGIVPQTILELDMVKILHIHPGIVPYFRGSDCLIWSAFIKGKLGASCFYMNPKIDEGKVIQTQEYPLPKIGTLNSALIIDDGETAYKLLLSTIDPHLRGNLFQKIVSENNGKDFRNLRCHEQIKYNRTAFLKIHPILRNKLIKKCFLPDHL
tara:strand:- start:490 stop:1350 length:861 start_codon:yes stop_codon:yes gene_type:complete